jgi:DNA-directed RNA polymerase subunit RPC12/RpoP
MWRAEPRGSSIEGDVSILRSGAPGGIRILPSGSQYSQDRAEGASSMEFQDKMLKCIDCGADFVFTAGEQLFFHDKQFKNEPKRCKNCKTKRVTVFGPPPVRQQTNFR